MKNIEHLQQSRENVRNITCLLPECMLSEPTDWWKSIARLTVHFKKQIAQESDPEVREYYQAHIDLLFTHLRSASLVQVNNLDDIISLTDHLIMEFSMEIARPFEQSEFHIESNFISIENLVKQYSDRFKTEHQTIRGELCTILQVRHPTLNEWHEIPLPQNRAIWHKGGPARAVLNMIADAPLSMQESEFPWNDFDALVGTGKKNKKAALAIGVDADGIEYMGEAKLNFPRYCAGRDTTQNQVCLGADGLYYSQAAFTTAHTGHTRIENEYVANKAIYGFDKMLLHGEELAKPRGIMRLLKAVVEGKALSFDYLPLNSIFDIGMQCCFLAKKWSKREKFPIYLQRMYYLLQQMGQVRAGEGDMFAVLERAHTESPFFDFDSEVREPLEVTRWKSRKLVKQIDREMGWRYSIPTDMEVVRSPGDTISSTVSLAGFSPNADALNVLEKWQHFLSRSRKRTAKYQEQDLTPYQKIFMNGRTKVAPDTDPSDPEMEDAIAMS